LYIEDFCIPKAKLVIEVDGSQHTAEVHAENDAARDEYINSRGYEVLRFTNSEVLTEIDRVIQVIYSHAGRRMKS
jgi:very-short-patch-repair endonuclease